MVEIIKAVKSVLGGGYRPAREDESNTHVILVQEDYDALQARIRALELELRDQRLKLNSEIERRDQNALAAQRQYEQSLAKEQQEVEAQKAAVVAAEAKNENLLRIMRERANAVRGLYPKGQRSGYLLQNMEEYEYTVYRGGWSRNISVWKVRLQSPYPVTLGYESARSSIYADLMDNGVGYRMGLKYIDTSDQTKELLEKESPDLPKGPGAYDLKYRATGRGYWEVEFHVAGGALIIPSDLTQLSAEK